MKSVQKKQCFELQMNLTDPVSLLWFLFPCAIKGARLWGRAHRSVNLWFCGGVHVWFMLTYWDLIWARLQPPGSICFGSDVRMSWNRINRQQDEGQRWWSTGETVFVGWVGYITLIFIKKTVFLKTELCCHALCAENMLDYLRHYFTMYFSEPVTDV